MDDQAQTETQASTKVPTWFWIAAGLALLFELFGCFMYYSQVTVDRMSLPIDQRAMWDATPQWIVAAYAVAVWVGLAGTVLLLMRRKLAEKLLLVSLIAVAVQFGGVLLVPSIREVTPSQAYNVPIAIFVICYGIWMLSRLARKRGWLR